MDRRSFLQKLAITAAAADGLAAAGAAAPAAEVPAKLDVEGYSFLCEFHLGAESWKVYEDLRTREGGLAFLSSHGRQRVLSKSAEASFDEAKTRYLGLDLKDIGMSGVDLLADKLLQSGDPDPEQVALAAPPLGSGGRAGGGGRAPWNTFVGTKECSDTMPVFPGGNTRTYHPAQYFRELSTGPQKRFEGMLGGWMPAVRKVFPVSDDTYIEIVVFGDVEAHDKFIVQTWHRTARIENGKMVKVEYGHSYPAFPPRRVDPKPEDFYRAMLVFAGYWDEQLRDFSHAEAPETVWIDMARHAFAKELMVRPGGYYPKYGAVDRDYYGSEYDGFQDIFTSSVYANLEWGRFEQARQVIDNYLTDFVDSKGMVNMRGPETAQFGMTLSLLAKYFDYTRDSALLLKHRGKIAATVSLLCELHDESLRLPEEDPGHGLIHGWSESDSCLSAQPMTWWQPYFSNSAFAARGLRDVARTWTPLGRQTSAAGMAKTASAWQRRSKVLQDRTVAAIEKNTRYDMSPPYIGPLPGTTLTFRESLEKERPSPQQWPHRAYAELLQADMLPPKMANTVIDCMRAYGATTMGVVANVGRARPGGRAILGFISYGYAQMLLRLDRVEEYLLFLYAHRFHDHNRGSWTAGEVAGITGGTALFCIPAQLTIPLLVRWMYVLEDSDEDRLYLGKGLPRGWVGSGKEIRIEKAATRWGAVNFRMAANPRRRALSPRSNWHARARQRNCT
ncbi:MAG TPA: hypothetical protein VG675_16945 [Bryobacteraceae bacterium]|nr:hypothetical protein [Bryobacteraceae bacterium]